jgi:hypothetical protein
MSDDLLSCTIIIVGVADSVEGLIEGHRSIDRAVKQISMPRMSSTELREIVEGGFGAFFDRSGIRIALEPTVVSAIVRMSQGFPYYTHLLAGSIGEQALLHGKFEVNTDDVFDALFSAIDQATHGIRVSYTDACTSSMKTASFDLTLLACALTPGNQLGYFAPIDIVPVLTELSGRTRKTDSFIAHLKRFAGPPSWILETRGQGRSTRYRFSDPLMRPFVLMLGIRDKKVPMP